VNGLNVMSCDVNSCFRDDMQSIKRMKPDTPTTSHLPSNGETAVTALHTTHMTPSVTALDTNHAPVMQPPQQTYNYTHSWPGYAVRNFVTL